MHLVAQEDVQTHFGRGQVGSRRRIPVRNWPGQGRVSSGWGEGLRFFVAVKPPPPTPTILTYQEILEVIEHFFWRFLCQIMA